MNGSKPILPQLRRGTCKVHPSPAKPHLPSQKATKPGKHHCKTPPASQVNHQDAHIPPIQQVQRSRNPPGKDGNGSRANPLGCSRCQTIPLPEESGAKAACAKAGGCWSKPLHSRRGTSPHVQPPGESRGCSAGTATASRSDRPRSAPRASPAVVSRGTTMTPL